MRFAEGDALEGVLFFEVCSALPMHDDLLAAAAACPHPVHLQWSRLPR